MKIIKESLQKLKDREEVCWAMANVFLELKDAHGITDMGVEIQALQRAQQELIKVGE